MRRQQQLGTIAPSNEQVVRRPVHRLTANGQRELVAASHQVVNSLVFVIRKGRDSHQVDQLSAGEFAPSGEITSDSHRRLDSLLFTVDQSSRATRNSDRARRSARAWARPPATRVHRSSAFAVHDEHPSSGHGSKGGAGLGQFDSDSYGAFDLAPLETLRTVAPRLIGRDPMEREAIWDEIRDHGTAPDMPGVRSALDIALWDLAARRAGLPLYRLIAPERARSDDDRLVAYASLPTLESPAAYADEVGRRRAEGYTAVKIHAWGDPDRDLEAIRAARDAGGNDMALIYDAEGCLDRASAERMADALGDEGVRWFEAPLPDLDLEGYRQLVRGGRVAIVPAGDAIWDPRMMIEVLREPPWSAMRFDVTFAGGITAALRLFEVAKTFGLDVELTSYGQTLVQAANLHVMLAFGRTSYFERAVRQKSSSSA